MATVYIGNARIAENGTVNGSKGDSTGREVMIQTWTSGGTWQYVIRPKSVTHASKIAAAMRDACKNNNIGYSQADRLSLYNLAKKNGFKLAKVGKCNCDCSSLVAVCCNAAGITVRPYMYTGNELALLKATKKFTVFTGSEYTKKSSKLRTGDILLRAGHTAIVTSGAVALSTTKKTTTTSLNKKQKWVGKVTAFRLNVRTGAGTSYSNIKAWPRLGYGNLVSVCDSKKAANGALWYYIKIANKYYGFASAKYIKKV